MLDKNAKTDQPKPAIPALDVETKLNAIRADVSALTEMIGTFVKDKMHLLGQTAEVTAEKTAMRTKAATEGMEQLANQAEKSLDLQVKEHPLQSIMMAFGLGILISLLIRR